MRLYAINVTVIYRRAILVAVTSDCRVKRVIGKHWQTVQTQIRRHRTRRLTRVCTACLNYRKLRVKWNSLKSPFSTILPILHSETIGSPLLSVFWLTLVLLNPDIPCFANSVDPDQLASAEANWSGSALFAIKYVNLYQQSRSSYLIGWKLKMGVAF